MCHGFEHCSFFFGPADPTNTTTTVRHTNARTSAIESRLVTIGPDCVHPTGFVYFHVLENTTLSWSAQQRLDLEMVNQYDTLSAAFLRTPFKFSFGGETRHHLVDNVLASTNTRGRPDLEDAIGLRFRVGGADTLNVYWSRG